MTLLSSEMNSCCKDLLEPIKINCQESKKEVLPELQIGSKDHTVEHRHNEPEDYRKMRGV